MGIEYLETSKTGLNKIAFLWEKLYRIHALSSPFFGEEYKIKTFTERKKELLEKAKTGSLKVFLARNTETGLLVGYCVCTVSSHVGEVDSIFVEETFRKHRIGNDFFERADAFFKMSRVKKQIPQVYAGNEKVMEFYKKQGYYPKYITLEKKA